MKENSSDKIEVSGSKIHSMSYIVKNPWQTPKLIEIDYNETNSGSGFSDDGTLPYDAIPS